MLNAVVAIALCSGFPSAADADSCPNCGCRHQWHGSCHGVWSGVFVATEHLFGSWYLDPSFGGNCNDRFHVSPAPHQGYYYFQPYNYRHLVQHSQDGAAFGEDPQLPYSNEMFRRRYRLKPEATPDHNMDPEAIPAEPRPMRLRGNVQPQLMPDKKLSPLMF